VVVVVAAAAAARVTLIVEATKCIFGIDSTNLPPCIITEDKKMYFIQANAEFVCTRFSTSTVFFSTTMHTLYLHRYNFP